MTASWLMDRSDRRVAEALTKTCPAYKAMPGQDCGWWRAGSRRPSKTGVVHQIRVPEDVLFEVTS